MKERNRLKNSNISIHEDLTRNRHKVLVAAEKSDKVSTCWTIDGRVFANVLTTNGEPMRKPIPNVEFLDSLPTPPAKSSQTS